LQWALFGKALLATGAQFGKSGASAPLFSVTVGMNLQSTKLIRYLRAELAAYYYKRTINYVVLRLSAPGLQQMLLQFCNNTI
jgi:hypothetical protein